MATRVLPEAPRAHEAQAAPGSRANWCGQLKLSSLCVPVEAYAAIASPAQGTRRRGSGRKQTTSPHPPGNNALSHIVTVRIEILVTPKGESTIQTLGFTGSSCREASKFIEQALGRPTTERLTADFHRVEPVAQKQQRA
jgi:hypothetical protein